MTGNARRGRLIWSLALVPLALTACGVSMTSGSGMMGGPAADAGMMNGGFGYHYSRLTCSAPADLPGEVVRVVLGDMNMMRMMSGTAPLGVRMMLRSSPVVATSGQVSFVAANMGWRPHELVILPLPSGAESGQRVPGSDGKIDETGSLGEASASCAPGTGEGIDAGSVGWLTVRLPPGRYELVCNMTNHYADGMYQEFTVT